MKESPFQSVFLLRTRIVAARHFCESCKSATVPRPYPHSLVLVDGHIHDVITTARGADIRTPPTILTTVAQVLPEFIGDLVDRDLLNRLTEIGTRVFKFPDGLIHDPDQFPILCFSGRPE